MAPKAVAKRKVDAVTPTPFEVEDPTTLPTVSPAEMARRSFMSTVAEPCPPAKHTSGSATAASAEGVVIRVGRITVSGKGGAVPKAQITVAVTKFVANGCKDIITAGVDGFYFGLPTRTLEASPDELAKDKHAKGPVLLEFDAANPRANYLGVMTASFYVDSSKPGPGTQVAGQGVESCVPGTKVLVTGISCTFARNESSGALYTNAKKIVPLSDTVAVGKTAASIIAEARSPNVQRAAALLWSMTMKGFFNLVYPEVAHAQQADAAKSLWQQVIDGTASRCENIALGLANDPTASEAIQALQSHATRVRSMSAESVASGEALFHVDIPKDCTTPYQAVLLQDGITPGNQVTRMCGCFFDDDTRAQTPSSFVEAKVTEVVFRGALMQISFRLFFLFDKSAAMLAIQDGKNPILHSQNSAASVKFSKRTIGQELFGVLCDRKLEMVATEILPHANLALWANVFPRDADSLQLDGHFANSSGIDLVDGILKVGVKVSQEWLDTSMLSGRGVHIFKPIDGAEYVEPSTSAGPAPSLSKNGLQALTETAFDVDSLKVPTSGSELVYHVVYDGCASDVASNPGITTSTQAGEQHLEDMVASKDDKNDVKTFLKEGSVVYAVAI